MLTSSDLLKNFQRVKIESPVDKIISQIKNLISSGKLKPGLKLPSERLMCERLGVGRMHLREAIKKLEFYGILQALPQSGITVAKMGVPALEGLITEMLSLNKQDFKSLVETRVMLEMNASILAAKNRTAEDIDELEKRYHVHMEKAQQGQQAVEEDLLFHIKVAEASKNTVLKSLILIIVPEVVSYMKKSNICNSGGSLMAAEQHAEILKMIKDQNFLEVADAILGHLSYSLDFIKSDNFAIKQLMYENLKVFKF